MIQYLPGVIGKDNLRLRPGLPDDLTVVVHIIHAGKLMLVLSKEFPVAFQGKHIAVWIDPCLIHLVQGNK